jgi:hypothetical protein
LHGALDNGSSAAARVESGEGPSRKGIRCAEKLSIRWYLCAKNTNQVPHVVSI